MKPVHLIIFVFSAIVLVTGCTKDKTPVPPSQVFGSNCDTNHVYFVNDILPILSSNCAKSGCHDAATHAEGYNFSNHAGAYSAIHPGNINNSKLYEVIASGGGEDMMPPAGNTPLTSAQVDMIAQWITQGGLNDECTEDSSSCNAQNMTYANDIAPIIANNCAGCHSGSSPSGGINLASYSGVAAVASTGKFYNAVAQNGMALLMPPTSRLSTCDINKIKAWVDAGYQNN